MTFEKFKKDFEACERFKPYSDEFKEILNEVLKAFQIKSFESGTANQFLGTSKDDIHFGYISNASLYIVKESVFENILQRIDENERILILSYCFSKYWKLPFEKENHNALCCTPSMMNNFMQATTSEHELFHIDDEFYNSETGEVFKKNDSKLEPKYIPFEYQGASANLNFKNARKL